MFNDQAYHSIFTPSVHFKEIDQQEPEDSLNLSKKDKIKNILKIKK